MSKRILNTLMLMALLLSLNSCGQKTETIYVDRYIESPGQKFKIPRKTDTSVLNKDVEFYIYPVGDNKEFIKARFTKITALKKKIPQYKITIRNLIRENDYFRGIIYRHNKKVEEKEKKDANNINSTEK